jgi:hypothetical protein
MTNPTRRTLLAASAASALALPEQPIPIIDTHFHLYDPARPQGVPDPNTPNPAPFLPRDLRESAIPLGIAGGIKVKASPWVEDNLSVLIVIENEPMIVGMVANLDPLDPKFPQYLERYHRNKLFLGIRYGNIWEGLRPPRWWRCWQREDFEEGKNPSCRDPKPSRGAKRIKAEYESEEATRSTFTADRPERGRWLPAAPPNLPASAPEAVPLGDPATP